MNKFGERLRQAREQKGVSLSQAAIATHILQQWLAALEEEAFDRLPNQAVARGFISNYSQYLGLPVHEMLELYRRQRADSGSIKVVSTSNVATNRSYVLPGFFGVFFMTIVLVGLTYGVLSVVGQVGTPRVAIESDAALTTSDVSSPLAQDEAAGDTERESAGVEELPADSALDPVSQPAGMALVTPAAATEGPFVVEVQARLDSGGSWLRVQTDDNTVYEEVLQPGERLVFEADQRLHIRASNPTVVEVSVDGQQPISLGNVPGRPINWYWPPR